MNDAGYYVYAGVAWLLVFYNAGRLRKAPQQPIRWIVFLVLISGASTMFFAAPPTIGIVNRFVGVANFSAPLVYTQAVACAAFCQLLIAYLHHHPVERAHRIARRWLSVYGLVVAALIALFALGDAPVERRVDFDTFYARTPYIAEFIVLYLVAHAWAMSNIGLMCWRWSKVAGRPWLRRGLRVFAFAVILDVIGFCGAKLTAVAARIVDVDVDVLSSAVAPFCAGAAAMIAAVGFAMPSFGERLTTLHARLHRYRQYRTLLPLWSALRDAIPGLVPPVRLPLWDLELRLTRRLTEIKDGQLALRSHFDPLVTDAAKRLADEAGLLGRERDAAVEAARIAAAIRAKTEGRRFADHLPNAYPGGTDLISELDWLLQVSRAFVNQPTTITIMVARQANPTTTVTQHSPPLPAGK